MFAWQKFIGPIVALLLALVAGWLVLEISSLKAARKDFRITAEVTWIKGGTLELFYGDSGGFDAERSQREVVPADRSLQRIHFRPGISLDGLTTLRLDPGDVPGDVLLHRIVFEGPSGSLIWKGALLTDRFTQRRDISMIPSAEGAVVLRSHAVDPQIFTEGDLSLELARLGQAPPRLLRIVLSLLVGLLTFIGTYRSLRALKLERPSLRRPTIVLLMVDAFVFIAFLGVAERMSNHHNGIDVRFLVISQNNDQFHLFRAEDPEKYNAAGSVEFSVDGSKAPQWISFSLPPDSLPRYLRLDFGSHGDTTLIIASALVLGTEVEHLSLQALNNSFTHHHDIDSIIPTTHGLLIYPSGRDPYVTIDLDLRPRMEALIARDSSRVLPFLTAIIAALLVHAGLRRSSLPERINAAPLKDVVLSTGFIALITFPFLILCNPVLEPRLGSSEKRRLVDLPTLELRAIGSFPSLFEEWYREHFGMRAELFRWNSWTHVKILGTSSLPDKVIVGKDGWLFQFNEHVDGNYRGITKYSFDELEAIRHKYEARQTLLARYGISYYLMIPPLSGNINRQYMPDRFVRVSANTWLDQVREHFHRYSTVPLIDPTASLIKAREAAPIYFKTDIHWNPYGAYFGYRDLITRIAQDDPEVGMPSPLNDFDFVVNSNSNADLANMLALNDVLTRVEPVCIPKRPRKAEYYFHPDLPGSTYFLDKPKTFVSPDTSKLNLLMFHDSFGLYMIPLISEHFHRSTYIWSGLFIPDIVPIEKPDVVVQECMEMFIENMPKDDVPRSW